MFKLDRFHHVWFDLIFAMYIFSLSLSPVVYEILIKHTTAIHVRKKIKVGTYGTQDSHDPWACELKKVI